MRSTIKDSKYAAVNGGPLSPGGDSDSAINLPGLDEDEE